MRSRRSTISTNLIALGNAIRKARITKGWSQAALASRCKLSLDQLINIERGHTKLRILMLVRIANVLGVSVAKPLRAAKL